MRYTLLVQYCTYLSFYLLMKSEGRSSEAVREHPVILKITTLKQMLDSLEELDSKVQSGVKKLIKPKKVKK